jgi:hypothetical protein
MRGAGAAAARAIGAESHAGMEGVAGLAEPRVRFACTAQATGGGLEQAEGAPLKGWTPVVPSARRVASTGGGFTTHVLVPKGESGGALTARSCYRQHCGVCKAAVEHVLVIWARRRRQPVCIRDMRAQVRESERR